MMNLNNIININILLPLQIIFPLFGSIVLVFITNYKLSNILTKIFLFLGLIISILILIFVFKLNLSHLSYVFGGYSKQLGIEYKVTKISSIFLFIISFIGFTSFIWGSKINKLEIDNDKNYLYNLLYITYYCGILGLIITNDLFNLFICLEISSIASYTIIGMNKSQKEAPMSALNYLILGSVATSFYVFGIGILYMLTGTLNIDILKNLIHTVHLEYSLSLSLIFIFLFILIKTASFPFSFWLPQIYYSSPSSFSTFLSGTGAKFILLAFFKIILIILSNKIYLNSIVISNLITSISLLTIILGSILAITQNDIKKILGYSSVSYLGYILLAISLYNKEGFLICIILLVISHSITKAGLFMISGNVKYIFNSTNLKNINGLSVTSRFTFISFIILGLSLIGFPFTLGFSAKWHLIINLIHQKFYFSTLIIILSSAISTIYIWKIIESMHFVRPSKLLENSLNLSRPTITMNTVIAVLVLINIILGLLSYKLVNYLTLTIHNY